MNMFDISVIINAHQEGGLIGATFKSVDKAVKWGRDEGLKIEIVVVADRADAATTEIIQRWSSMTVDARVFSVNFGDLGLSRNHGVDIAHGKWIAFLDGDDLWGFDWLTKSYLHAESEIRSVVWHPEASLYFGIQSYIFLHIDMDDSSFDVSYLAQANLWTALCFAERKLLLDIPYKPTIHDKQIGYEDWGWNMEVIAGGGHHKVVPGTLHAVRVKPISLVGQTTAAGCLPHPTNLFRNILENKINYDFK